MKKLLLLTAIITGFSTNTNAQAALIYQEGNKFGLKTDFGKELLPANCDTIFKIETAEFDFYVADENGSSSMYSYLTDKREIFDETTNTDFTEIRVEYSADLVNWSIIGIDKLGNKFKHQDEGGWAALKSKSKYNVGRDYNGKYAICTSTEAVTGYDYDRVNTEHAGFFLALTDSGYIVYNDKVEIAYPFAVRNIYKSKKHTETYIASKGAKWGIFSSSEEFYTPLLEYKNPKYNFTINKDISNADLNRSFSVKRGGKWGVIDAQGKEIMPFIHDDAYMFKQYDINLHQLPFIGIVKLNGKWKFINKKYKDYKEVEIDNWICIYGNIGIVQKGAELFALDLKTFETSKKFGFADGEKIAPIKSDNGMFGLIDENGKILMPFEYEIITLDHREDGTEYLIATKNGKDGIYDETGKMLVPHKYRHLIQIASADKEYFEISNGKLVALGYWDTEKHKIIILTDYIYEYLTFESTTEGKPIAIGTTPEGKDVKIYRDGKQE
ncbi:MAG: WG repeat-containing protein [Crocinitomicaceae bacterium]|nr:WG repeat-containing protein [Crocinitomicaceae bacterium]